MKIKNSDHSRHSVVGRPFGIRVALCLLFAGLSPALADGSAKKPATPAPVIGADGRPVEAELVRGDRRFFKKAARLGEREVALSRAAANHAVDTRVQAFADEMARAHTKANEELMALALRKGVVIEKRDVTEQRAEEKKWAEKKADVFDKDYIDEIIDLHEDSIDVLEKGAKSKDADIAALATRMLPEVKSHLVRAEALEDALH